MPAAQKVFATRSQKSARLWCIIREKNHAKEQHHVQHRHRRFRPGGGVRCPVRRARWGADHRAEPRAPGRWRAPKRSKLLRFAQPVSGPELERRSIENARRLGVQFVQTEAVGLTWTDRLTVETLAGAYPADAVILATGASRAVPRIPGLTGLEGHGVSWCAACDAFFYRGKDVAVLGSGEVRPA